MVCTIDSNSGEQQETLLDPQERVVKDYSDLARLGGVSRARITQIMNMRNLAPSIVIATMEAVLIEGLEPRQNRKRGDDFQAIEFLQVEDPKLEMNRKLAIIQELGAQLKT